MGVAKVLQHAELLSGKRKKLPSGPAQGSNLLRFALNVILNARFHFGGEWVVYKRIPMFFVVFLGVAMHFLVFSDGLCFGRRAGRQAGR